MAQEQFPVVRTYGPAAASGDGRKATGVAKGAIAGRGSSLLAKVYPASIKRILNRGRI